MPSSEEWTPSSGLSGISASRVDRHSRVACVETTKNCHSERSDESPREVHPTDLVKGCPLVTHACVYMLASTSRTLYTGVTSDLEARVWQHKTHALEGFTKRYNVTKLVWFAEFARYG
jgi:putative endonuclease